MQIQLGHIVKRLNSTRNDASFTAYNGTLKESCDMLNPVIEFNFGNSNPSGYNYMYIPDFGRYYYVTWEFRGSAHWYAHGSVDVLGSAKTAIGMSPKYVMRSASESDEYIIDTLYPAKCVSQDYSISVASGLAENPVQGGSYVVGIIGGNWQGAISYYIMNTAAMNSLIGLIFNNNYASSGGVTDTWDNFTMKLEDIPVKTLINPAQYITSVMWYPVALSGSSATNSIRFAWWWANLAEAAWSAGPRLKYLLYTVDYSSLFAGGVPKYRYSAPYAEYMLRVPGFGVINLPSSAMVGLTSIQIRICIDIYTGAAVCEVANSFSLPIAPQIIARASGIMGVSFAIGGFNYNYGGALSSASHAIQGGIGAAVTKDPLAALGAGASAVESAANFFATETRTIGGHGSTADIHGDIVFMCRHADIAEEHIVEFGRPLCKIKTLNTLTGFIQCANGDIQCDLTDTEKQQIKQYLEGGFYYE